MDGEEHILNTL